MSTLKVALAFACLALACGPKPPPDHFSIASDFSAPEAETIRAAVDGWCDAVDYCPTEVRWAERGRITMVDSVSAECPAGTDCRAFGQSVDEDRIEIARNRYSPDDMAQFWVSISHEIGHYCTNFASRGVDENGHTRTGLMAPAHDAGEALIIDTLARVAWKNGCP